MICLQCGKIAECPIFGSAMNPLTPLRSLCRKRERKADLQIIHLEKLTSGRHLLLLLLPAAQPLHVSHPPTQCLLGFRRLPPTSSCCGREEGDINHSRNQKKKAAAGRRRSGRPTQLGCFHNRGFGTAGGRGRLTDGEVPIHLTLCQLVENVRNAILKQAKKKYDANFLSLSDFFPFQSQCPENGGQSNQIPPNWRCGQQVLRSTTTLGLQDTRSPSPSLSVLPLLLRLIPTNDRFAPQP